jgi:hypothetical protein
MLDGNSVPKNIFFCKLNFHPLVKKTQSEISKVDRWSVLDLFWLKHLGLKFILESVNYCNMEIVFRKIYFSWV